MAPAFPAYFMERHRAGQLNFFPVPVCSARSIVVLFANNISNALHVRRETVAPVAAFLFGGAAFALGTAGFSLLPIFARFIHGGIAFTVTYLVEYEMGYLLWDVNSISDRIKMLTHTLIGSLIGSQIGAAVIAMTLYTVTLPQLGLLCALYPITFLCLPALEAIAACASVLTTVFVECHRYQQLYRV